jgi:hypothetical protein
VGWFGLGSARCRPTRPLRSGGSPDARSRSKTVCRNDPGCISARKGHHRKGKPGAARAPGSPRSARVTARKGQDRTKVLRSESDRTGPRVPAPDPGPPFHFREGRVGDAGTPGVVPWAVPASPSGRSGTRDRGDRLGVRAELSCHPARPASHRVRTVSSAMPP